MRLPHLNDLIQDLQLAKQIAIEDKNPNALIMATVGKEKLLGLDKVDIEPVPVSMITNVEDVRKANR